MQFYAKQIWKNNCRRLEIITTANYVLPYLGLLVELSGLILAFVKPKIPIFKPPPKHGKANNAY
jgi:hypothetical protein